LKSGEAGALLLCRRWKFGGVEALKELEAHQMFRNLNAMFD
jgi:hypothetical protein